MPDVVPSANQKEGEGKREGVGDKGKEQTGGKSMIQSVKNIKGK